MKNKIFLLIAILITLSITASCNRKSNTQGGETNNNETPGLSEDVYESEDLNIMPFNERKFIYRNGLKIESKQETINEGNINIGKYYPQINGLVNKEVEKKVNESIASSVDVLNKEIESFIISKFTDENATFDSSISAEVSYSCNNVIFIHYYSNVTCNTGLDSDPYRHISSERAEGFDLNTGNKLELKDLFKRGSDYKKIINDYIYMEIIRCNYDDPDSLYMNKPFQGIKENQSFSFNENYLTIIMDEKNDEFNTSEYPVTIMIPLKEIGDELAIFDRYFDEEINIFENERFKQLMTNFIYYNVKGAILEREKNYNIQIETGEFINLDDIETKNMLEDMISQNMDVDGFKERADTFALSNPGEYYGSMEHRISVKMSAGGYLSMTVDSVIDEHGVTKNENKYINYDFNNNKFMTFKDLFADGFDYKTKIIEFIKKDNSYHMQDTIINEEDVILSENEFSFNQNYIFVNFSQPMQDIINNYAWVRYEDIGFENIAILQIQEQNRYTGEIIVDGFYGNKGRIYFVPDKETRELLKNEYPYTTAKGESIPLDYDDISIVKDLPKELGIYKAEVEADYKTGNIISKLKSIKLTEKIGTVEYEGKEYPTNELDEYVNVKDRVCGLIVSNVDRTDGGGIIIEFEGEIESEGFYNVYPGGEYFDYKRIGRIVPDGESVKNFPAYKGEVNPWSVYFIETNELYRQLAEHSAIGRGKFKSKNYRIVYNHGMGVSPREALIEIISLDEKYKGFFTYDDNSITRPLVNEKNKYKAGFMDKYAIVYNVDDYNNESSPRNYYFFGFDEMSKIKILSTNEFYYGLNENNGEYPNEFELITDTGIEKPHSISFRYFDKIHSSNGKDSIWKNYSYGYFKNDDEIVRVFEGESISGMTAEDINVEYICTQDSSDVLIRIRCNFSGETTLTGKLTSYFDEGYMTDMVYFVADEEGIKKLPIYDDDMRSQGSIAFDYESVKEIIGTEKFEKNCEITINNYEIYKAHTEAKDTADLVAVKFLE